MGAQKKSVTEDVDNLVDISPGEGGLPGRAANIVDIIMSNVDDPISSSTCAVGISVSEYHADEVDVSTMAGGVLMECAPVMTKNGDVGDASKKIINSIELARASKLGEPDVASQVEDLILSPVRDFSGGFSVVPNCSQPERERFMSMTMASRNSGSRKRKNAIPHMDSRAPGAVPAGDSDGGSDGQESLDEADDVLVRGVSQGPRAAATKLKSMLPVGDKLLKAPRNAKELMATRLLEGHFVRCQCRGIHLTGMLKDMGVRCDCRNCRGSVIVSISAFEAHSGSTSHHPSDNIYLENGKNLRDILSAGQEAADCGDNILRALKMVIGDIKGVGKRTIACAKCGNSEEGDLIPCNGPRCPLVFHSGCTGVANLQLGDWFCPKCENRKKPRGVVKAKRPFCAGAEEDVRGRERGKTAFAKVARDENLYKSLFLPGGLEDGTELGYYLNSQIKMKGVKRGEGICCDCCNKEMSCPSFEQHAGFEARRNPYGNILLVADGRSLKEISKGLSHQNKLGEKAKRVAQEEEVSSCFGCGYNGDLKCNDCGQTWCSDCAKGARHQGVERDIDGKWHCQFCDPMKEEKNGQNATGKHVEELTEKDERGRSIRLLQAPLSAGGCAICKKWNSSKSGFVIGMTMLVCDQCGREYHVTCLKDEGMHDLNELPEGEWFCQKDCKVIDEILAQLVANGSESLSDSIISQLLESRQHQIGGDGNAESSSPSFGWQILCGRGCDSANVQTLGEAANIFSECSDPIRDARSGRNLIPAMVHSRRSKEFDFEGVFCVVLKRNDKVVSAALLQIFGREVAEVPLVATSLPHQGQGYCRALLTTIERLLGVLSVGRLVLPTSEDTELIWINKFGFSRMTDEQLLTICTTIRLMKFTGTCMLGKRITPMTV